MAKIPKRLEEIRDTLVFELFEDQVSAQDIATILGMTTSAIYNILKEYKIINKERT